MNAYEKMEQLSNIIVSAQRKFDLLKGQVENGCESYTDIDNLQGETSVFIGYKPISIELPDGSKHQVKKWNDVAKVLVTECVKDSSNHERIKSKANMLYGNKRLLLSTTPDELERPIKICDDIYFETHTGTENMLNIIKKQFLMPLGYDLSKIWIEYA